MFGINRKRPDAVEARLSKLQSLLDRRISIDSLSALASGIRHKPIAVAQLQDVAIGIDSSVFLKIVGHRKSADIIDYLSLQHAAPLILPGQAVQEFWNNQ